MAYGEGGGRGRGGFGGGGFGGRRSFAPVNVGDEVDVRIEAVGEKGDGVAKVKGFVLFVPGVKEGEECRIKVSRVLKKVGFADKIGDAQGPIEEDQPPARESEPEIQPEEQAEEPAAEDSEDFGEEPAAEEAPAEETPEEEAPAEEPVEEEPAEEEKKE